MQVTVYQQASNYLERVQPFLEARETINNLILGVTIRLHEHPEWIDEQPYLAAVEDSAGRLLLAAAITPPQRVLLTAEPYATPAELEKAIDSLITNMREGGWFVPGLLAEKEIAQCFAERWQLATGESYKISTRERAYELRRVIPPPHPPSGYLRSAVQDDIETITRWHFAFVIEAINEGDMQESRTIAERRVGAGDAFVWDDGRPVSMAFRARPTPHGYTVSAVYTPPEQRGHGYASACVAGLSQLLLDSGKEFCTLFTDLSNPTSNSIYQKIGYCPVGDFDEYHFFTPDTRPDPAK